MKQVLCAKQVLRNRPFAVGRGRASAKIKGPKDALAAAAEKYRSSDTAAAAVPPLSGGEFRLGG